jgi:hypothetical protein
MSLEVFVGLKLDPVPRSFVTKIRCSIGLYDNKSRSIITTHILLRASVSVNRSESFVFVTVI